MKAAYPKFIDTESYDRILTQMTIQNSCDAMHDYFLDQQIKSFAELRILGSKRELVHKRKRGGEIGSTLQSTHEAIKGLQDTGHQKTQTALVTRK